MVNDDNISMTTAKTLWAETILEVLYQSLKSKKPDDAIKEVRQKVFNPDEIITKVEKSRKTSIDPFQIIVEIIH